MHLQRQVAELVAGLAVSMIEVCILDPMAVLVARVGVLWPAK